MKRGVHAGLKKYLNMEGSLEKCWRIPIRIASSGICGLLLTFANSLDPYQD